MINEQELKEFVISQLENDNTGHGIDHIQRVVDMSKKILATEPSANTNIVLLAAWLHDTYDDKLFKDTETQKKKVAEFLATNGIDSKPIFHIIDNMSWSKQIYGDALPLDINGQIVQDADRLDAIGVVGTVRTFIFGNGKDRIMYDEKIKPRDIEDKDTYRDLNAETTTINHFYEKLFKIKDYLNTNLAKEIGEVRDKRMHNFVDEFISEWELDS